MDPDRGEKEGTMNQKDTISGAVNAALAQINAGRAGDAWPLPANRVAVEEEIAASFSGQHAYELVAVAGYPDDRDDVVKALKGSGFSVALVEAWWEGDSREESGNKGVLVVSATPFKLVDDGDGDDRDGEVTWAELALEVVASDEPAAGLPAYMSGTLCHFSAADGEDDETARSNERAIAAEAAEEGAK